MGPQEHDPEFTVIHEREPPETLIAGFSEFGLAGLTAVDYLVDHLDLEQRGHVSVEQFPTITPFENGTPRHHTRLYSRDDLDVTILVGELFVPRTAAEPLGDAVLEWTDRANVSEAVLLTGVPIPHGPDDHQPFYVATDDYRERRLTDAEIAPMGRGFLDGVGGAMVERGMSSDLAVGTYLTPVHERVPDVDAALRLLSAVQETHELDISTGPLETFANEIGKYYEELASRLEDTERRDLPEDRMYM